MPVGSIVATILLLIGIFFTAKFWLWLYNRAFGLELNKKIVAISLFFGGIAAGTILLFPKIMTYFGQSSFTDYDFSFHTLLWFAGYLFFLSLIFTLLFGKLSKQQVLNLIAFNVFFVVLFFIFKHLNLSVFVLNVLLYYLFVAYGEELIKNQLAFGLYNKIAKVDTDLLLFHVLTAIGFAFWENIVYLTGAISFDTFLITFFGGLGIVITRGLLGFGAHTFYSSLVGMGNLLGVLMIFFYILLAMLIHYGYDVSLYFNYKIIIPIFILVVYLWISWIFYKIDRLYLD